MNAPRKTQGFTLIEMMLVMAAAVALIGMAMGTWRWVQNANQAAAAQAQTLALATAARSVFPGTRYEGLTTDTMRLSGLLPASMTAGRSGLLNPWGGATTITPVERNGVPNAAFRITLAGVPRSGCATLLANVQEQFQRITLFPSKQPIKDHFASPLVEYTSGKAVAGCAGANAPTATPVLETY